MKNNTKIFSNSFYLLLDLAVITLLSFIFWFILGRLLTPAETGVVFTSWGLSSIISVLTIFGLQSALVKLISENENDKKVSAFIQISFKYVLIANVTAFLLIILLHQYFSSLIGFTFLITLLTGLNVFIVSLSNLSSAVLGGFQSMKKIFTTDFIGYTFKILAIPILVFIGLSSTGALIALFGTFFLIFILRAKPSWFSFKTSSEIRSTIFKYSLPSFVSGIAGIVFSNIQYVILTIIKNAQATGIFGYAMLVTSPLDLITITFGSALFPIISNLSTRNSGKTQSYLLNLITRYSLMIVLPAAVFLAYFGKPFFLIFFPQYVSAIILFPFLIPAAIIFGIASIFSGSIFALRKPHITRNISVIMTLSFIGLSIPLTQMFSSNGLAAAYLISTVIMLLLSYFYISKLISLKIPFLSLTKLILATILFFIFLVISGSIVASIFVKIFFVAIGFVFYVLGLFLVKFFIKEDVDILRAFERRLPIMKKQIHFVADFIEKRI